jgi:amidase
MPVFQKGALLAIGDMHASMGDGEISGTGVEIGGDVLIEVNVIKGKSGRWPITETADSWFTHGTTDADLNEAIKLACEEAAQLLVEQWGFTWEDAFIFLSVAGDVGIAQSCHPSPGSKIARMRVPKIAACPRPFKGM